MLANLYAAPKSDADWEVWSWSHRQSHASIIQAIQQRYGVTLPLYAIYPIHKGAVGFLELNRLMHTDMYRVVGGQTQDLQQVDLNDPKQLPQWNYAHYLEHLNIEQKLGIGS